MSLVLAADTKTLELTRMKQKTRTRNDSCCLELMRILPIRKEYKKTAITEEREAKLEEEESVL